MICPYIAFKHANIFYAIVPQRTKPLGSTFLLFKTFIKLYHDGGLFPYPFVLHSIIIFWLSYKFPCIFHGYYAIMVCFLAFVYILLC